MPDWQKLIAMEVLRQSGIYSLVYNPDSENESLKYHIDNIDEVSEFLDETEAEELLSFDEETFNKECSYYFQ